MSNGDENDNNNSQNQSNSINLSQNEEIKFCPEFNELYNEIKVNCPRVLNLFRIICIALDCDPEKDCKINEINFGLHGLETLIKPHNWQSLKEFKKIKTKTNGVLFIKWNQLHSICKSMVEKWQMDHKFCIFY